jgi:hypothetical protein
LLQAGIAGEICMEDVDVGTVAQLCRHFLLGRSLVADQTDDYVLRALRNLLDELELRWIKNKSKQCVTRHKADSPRSPSTPQ